MYITNNGYSILPTNKDLCHHGINGQKWGVRNGPPYPLSKGKRFKDRKTNIGFIKQEKNMDKPHYLKKGTKIYRTTSSKDESNTGSTYVSYTSLDRRYYKEWVRGTAELSGKKAYEKTFELKEDLKICGTNDVKEVFQKIIDKIGNTSLDTAAKDFVIGDRVKNKDINQAKKDSELVNKFNDYFDENADKVNVIDATDLRDNTNTYRIVDISDINKTLLEIPKDTYQNGTAYLRAENLLNNITEGVKSGKITNFEYGIAALTKNDTLRNQMIKELQSKGYDAMPDLAGAGIMPNSSGKGYTREGLEPLIIFDRSKTLKEISTKEVNLEESLKGYRNSRDTMYYMKDRKRG